MSIHLAIQACKIGCDNREELIPEVGFLNRTPIHYRVHSNAQALTPSNLVPRLSVGNGIMVAKRAPASQYTTNNSHHNGYKT